ncbi:uncharacterized protein LY89DRAFT_716730 [Mollisia scopiformis]|uniref:Uncharacterized protein n=1 Tax=Mollisia scopiformis TaxID=149040 RepID=A0A194XH88_MOLSC|nr:uncharacterized protein LY89DRAFT_716730 [Mollisia scopiformis]KUJ19137.1 hypothetical protein LY89DRAFT_716730 [Mollisia scopiformis]
MADALSSTLIRILRDRDIPYDREAIKAAFADKESQTAVQAWIEEYLSPETLLTKDEAALYATLTKTGEADTLAAQDLSMIQGLSEEETHTAIEELKRSTAAIEKQTETLRLQQNAMSALVKTEKRAVQSRSQIEKAQTRKWDVERGQISAAIEELSQSLIYQTSDLDQQLKGSEANARQTVDSILKSDDKLLLSLQKLASDLDPGKPEDDVLVARIRELCARYIKHTVEGIRTRLDRIYLEALSQSRDTNGHGADGQEAVDLQEELESLYSEILPVAQMSAEQQYLEPALRSIAATNGKGQRRAVKAVTYIHECLVFLINRIETFLQRAQESQCHNMALQFVLDSAKTELKRTDALPGVKPTSPAKSNTQRRRKSSGSQSSLKVRNTRRSSGHLDEDLDPAGQLARNLSITLPAADASDEERITFLERALMDRASKLESHMTSLQSTTETSIASHLLDAHVTLNLLRDSLLADTDYHTVHLVDQELESSVNSFENDIQALQEDLEAVDLYSLQTKNVHKEQLVERWSR